MGPRLRDRAVPGSSAAQFDQMAEEREEGEQGGSVRVYLRRSWNRLAPWRRRKDGGSGRTAPRRSGAAVARCDGVWEWRRGWGSGGGSGGEQLLPVFTPQAKPRETPRPTSRGTGGGELGQAGSRSRTPTDRRWRGGLAGINDHALVTGGAAWRRGELQPAWWHRAWHGLVWGRRTKNGGRGEED